MEEVINLEQRILRLEVLSLELIKGLEATSSALREVLNLTTLQQKSNAETLKLVKALMPHVREQVTKKL